MFHQCSTFIWMSRPMRGEEKLDLPPAMFPGMHREQQRAPPQHLHPPPPPHRVWEQQYDSHHPPHPHPVLSLPNDHAMRLFNGYPGSGAHLLNPHLPPNRPNPLLKVRGETKDDTRYASRNKWSVHVFSVGFIICFGLGGFSGSPGSTTAGRRDAGSGAPGRSLSNWLWPCFFIIQIKDKLKSGIHWFNDKRHSS